MSKTRKLDNLAAPLPQIDDLDPVLAREHGVDLEALETAESTPGFLENLADRIETGALDALQEVRRRAARAQDALRSLTTAERDLLAQQGVAEVLRKLEDFHAMEQEHRQAEAAWRTAILGLVPVLSSLRLADERFRAAATEVRHTAADFGVNLDPLPGHPSTGTPLPRGRRFRPTMPHRDWGRGLAAVVAQEARRLADRGEGFS